MVYKKIKIGFHNYNNRFNRTILVREDINLIELGCVICTSLRAEFEHYFLFIRNDLYYTPDCFIESPLCMILEIIGNLIAKFIRKQ